MSYNDKKFGPIFPVRNGVATGSANERQMLDTIGGSESFRTRIQKNDDGSETILRTKNGMPQFTTISANQSPATENRGFVVTGNVLSSLLKKTNGILIRFITAALSAWRWAYPISSSSKRALFYSVSTQRVGPTTLKTEDKYNDVLCVVEKKLLQNGVQFSNVPNGASGIPIAQPGKFPEEVCYAANDSLVLVANGIEVSRYEFSKFHVPIVPGSGMAPAPIIGDDSVEFMASLLTAPGALQIWRSRVQAFSLAQAESFSQLDARGPLRLIGGNEPTVEEPIKGPWFTPPATAYVLGDWYRAEAQNTPLFLVERVMGDSLVTNDTGYITRYARNNSFSESVSLYPGISATTSAAVEATAEKTSSGTVSLYTPTWPYDQPLYIWPNMPGWPKVDPEGHYITIHGLYSPGVPPITKGQTVGGSKYGEWGVHLEQSCTTSISTTIDAVGAKLLELETSGAKVHTIGGYVAHEISVMQLGGVSGGPSDDPFALAESAGADVYGQESVSISFSVNGTSRDYFYFDKKEEVYGWVEGKMASSGTDGASLVTISVSIKVSIRGNEKTELVYYWTSDGVNNPNYVQPDVNFGTGVTWAYHAPTAPQPLFAPKWCHQGVCPYIAYTTKSEQECKDTWFFSFALRIQQLLPPVGYVAPSLNPGEADVIAPMFEWMVGHYGGIRTSEMWAGLREQINYISGSSEGYSNWADSVLGTTSAKVVEIYRT